MSETETMRVYKSDKKRMKEIAEATGKSTADVMAEFIREPAYVCPECEEPFSAEEIDPDTVEERGVMTTSIGNLVKGQRDLESFECPCCDARVRPDNLTTVDSDDAEISGVTRRDIGVTDENTTSKFSTEEV